MTRARAIARAMLGFRMFDRSAVSARAGVVAAIPVAAMIAIGAAIGEPVAATTMGAGAMLGGVAWRAGAGAGPAPPIGTMFAAVATLGVVTVAGSASGFHHWIHFGLLVVLCLIAGLATSLGRHGRVVGTQSIIAFVVFGRFPQPLPQAAGLAGLVMLGGLAQASFATVVALPPAWRLQRRALAAAYLRLAELAVGPGASGIPSGAALDDAERKLAAPALLSDPALMTLSSLIDQGRRIRLELSALGALLEQGRRGAAAAAGDALAPADEVAAALARAATVLELIAATIGGEDDDAPGRLGAAVAAMNARVQERARSGRIDARFAALAGQITAAARLAGGAARRGESWIAAWTEARPSRGSRQPWRQLQDAARQLRSNATLRSASGRHAARLAVVVAGTELLTQHVALPRGYWAVVAAAAVLRPEFGATFKIGAERVLGTCVGVVVATLIAVALDPGGYGVVVTVGLLAWFTYAVFPASFAAGTAGLTSVIVFLLHAVAPDSPTIALDRGLDTLVGGAIGLLAYAAWPTLSGMTTDRALAELLSAQRRYLAAVLAPVIEGSALRDADARPLARAARMAWSNAESAVALAQAEPELGGVAAVRRSQALQAGMRRVILAIHTLRLEAVSLASSSKGRPELAAVADGLDRTLAAVAGTLAGERSGGAVPALRARFLAAASRSGAADDPVLAQLDELVDAANSLAELVGLSSP